MAPSALPGLDAIRDLSTDLDEDEHVGIRVSGARALVAAVEAAALLSYRLDRLPAHDHNVIAARDRLRDALAPFRVRDVTADEVPQKLIDDVRAAGLATAHLGDEVWGGEDR